VVAESEKRLKKGGASGLRSELAWRKRKKRAAAPMKKGLAAGRFPKRTPAGPNRARRQAELRGQRRLSAGLGGKRLSARSKPNVRGGRRLHPAAAAVVCVPAQPALLLSALRPLLKLPLREIVAVVLGEASPALQAAIGAMPKVRALYLPDEKDEWRARAAGAAAADGDVVLFAGGSHPASSKRLAAFLKTCGRGCDVALNRITPQLGIFARWSREFRLAAFLNRALNRRDLGADSLQTLPFALSRRALRALGPEMLENPLKAQAAALRRGLRVRAAASVPLPNTAQPGAQTGLQNGQAAQARQGDEEKLAEAWREALRDGPFRLTFPDRIRMRSVLAEGMEATVQGGIP